MRDLSSLSTQYVRVKVTATDENGNPLTISGDTVQFAFTRLTDNPSTWVAGTWGASNVARCLVGPGGVITLTPERYQVWIKITDNPEIPVIKVDTLTVV